MSDGLARFARSPVVARFARSQRCGYLPRFAWGSVFNLQTNFCKRSLLRVCHRRNCKRCAAASPRRRVLLDWFATPSASFGGFHTCLVRLRSASATLRLLAHVNKSRRYFCLLEYGCIYRGRSLNILANELIRPNE